jgi:hypothetical protein
LGMDGRAEQTRKPVRINDMAKAGVQTMAKARSGVKSDGALGGWLWNS